MRGNPWLQNIERHGGGRNEAQEINSVRASAGSGSVGHLLRLRCVGACGAQACPKGIEIQSCVECRADAWGPKLPSTFPSVLDPSVPGLARSFVCVCFQSNFWWFSTSTFLSSFVNKMTEHCLRSPHPEGLQVWMCRGFHNDGFPLLQAHSLFSHTLTKLAEALNPEGDGSRETRNLTSDYETESEEEDPEPFAYAAKRTTQRDAKTITTASSAHAYAFPPRAVPELNASIAYIMDLLEPFYKEIEDTMRSVSSNPKPWGTMRQGYKVANGYKETFFDTLSKYSVNTIHLKVKNSALRRIFDHSFYNYTSNDCQKTEATSIYGGELFFSLKTCTAPRGEDQRLMSQRLLVIRKEHRVSGSFTEKSNKILVKKVNAQTEPDDIHVGTKCVLCVCSHPLRTTQGGASQKFGSVAPGWVQTEHQQI